MEDPTKALKAMINASAKMLTPEPEAQKRMKQVIERAKREGERVRAEKV